MQRYLIHILSVLIIAYPLSWAMAEDTPLVMIEGVGGLCPSTDGNGVICNQIATQLFENGLCTGQCKRRQISSEEIAHLKDAINNTNFPSLKQKQPGICPSAYDGQDAIYTFHTSKGDEQLNTCTYSIDMTQEPFKTLLEILGKTK